MKIDIGLYEKQKKPTIAWYYRQGHEDAKYTIGTLSCCTMIPCIVLACWLGEERGFDEEITNTIKVLVDFYGYNTVMNAPADFPTELLKT